MFKKFIPIIVVFVFILMVLPQACVTIKANEVGVVKTFGKIDHELARGSGLNFKIPIIQNVTKLDMSPKTVDITFGIGNDAAVSKDMQSIGCTITLVYRFKEDGIINYVTNFTESSLQSRFKSNIRAAIKETIGKYSVYDLTGETQNISSQVQSRVSEMSYDMPIEVTQVNVTNFDWSEDFDRQIKETMQRTQQEKTAKAEVAIAEAAAQKSVKEAEAQASAIKAKAEGELEVARLEAEARRIRADSIAYENQKISENRQIMEAQWKHEETMKELEKWNGKQPGSDATIITPNYTVLPISESRK